MASSTTATASQTLTTVTPEIHKVEPISGFMNIWGYNINPSVIALTCVFGSILYMLWKAQRDQNKNSFDVWDLLMDTQPTGKRKASGIKSTYQAAFIVSTWVIIDQEIKGTLNDAIFGLYLATWCASLIAKVVFDKTDPIQIPAAGK